MRCLTIDVKNSKSQDDAVLYLYLLDDSPEIAIHNIFERGDHGLSLANRLTGCIGNGPERAAEEWIHLVHRWMENWIEEVL